MRHLLLTISAILITIVASAQEADTDATAGKLDFERPQFLVSDYFGSIKAHLSKEGRKEWKSEFTLRENVMLGDLSTNVTAGIRTSPNKVFGFGAGLGQTYFRISSISLQAERFSIYAYHRHYIPLGHRKNFSLYSDLMIGARYIYKMGDGYLKNGIDRGDGQEPSYPVLPGDWLSWISWQPGFAVNMWGKSNLFIGLSICPYFGFHAGITL